MESLPSDNSVGQRNGLAIVEPIELKYLFMWGALARWWFVRESVFNRDLFTKLTQKRARWSAMVAHRISGSLSIKLRL